MLHQRCPFRQDIEVYRSLDFERPWHSSKLEATPPSQNFPSGCHGNKDADTSLKTELETELKGDSTLGGSDSLWSVYNLSPCTDGQL